MKIRTGIVFVGAATLAGALLFACGSQDDNPSNPGGTGGHAGTSGSGGTGGAGGAGGSAGVGGAGGGAGDAGSGGTGGTAGAGGDGGSAGSGGSAGGGGAPTGDGGTCNGTATTITNVANGTVSVGTQVKLTGVVATSQKFLVSRSASTGSCLWGMFVSEPNLTTAAAYSGTMVADYGDDAVTDPDGGFGDCPTGTDLIPEDTKPGDVFDVVGKADKFVSKSCAGDAGTGPAAQAQVSKACLVTRTGTNGQVPAPAVITNAADLMNGADEATHRKWGGVLVKLENVSPQLWDGGGVVGPYGIITLTNGLEVHDKLYYDKNDKSSGPKFASGTTFNSITGISYLDFCTWALEPRDKCQDFDPPSSDCGGADASAD